MNKKVQLDDNLLIRLADSALSGDYTVVRRTISEVARACLDQGADITAKQLNSLARKRGVPLQTSGAREMLPVDGGSRLPLIDEEPWPTKPVILNDSVQGTVSRFLADVRNSKVLLEKGLLTRFGLMLSGPPGTGKTLLAGHIAAQLQRPFFVARLDSLISSRLGETAKNIRQIFDFVPANGAVLFLDELDAVAKMRDDRQELGELKRVVNTVIQGLDSLDDHAVVIAATNHPQLLDAAIWRRFPYQAELGLPNFAAREALWLYFLYEGNTSFVKMATLLGRVSEGFTGADIENLSLATRRLALLENVDLPEAQLLFAISVSKLPTAVEFPHPGTLSADEKQFAVKQLASREGVVRKQLFHALGVPRQTGYNWLSGGRSDE